MLEQAEWSTLTPPFLFGRSLRLDECFADLHFIPGDQVIDRGGGDERHMASEDSGATRFLRAQSVESVLASLRPRTVMVGAPGAGKTTFVLWLARQIKLGMAKPFNTSAVISLAAFARELRARPGTRLYAFFLQHQLGVARDTAEQLADALGALASGGGDIVPLLLLDGWDEVPDDLRRDTLDAIRTDSRPFFTIITSRPSGIPRVFEEDWAALYEISALSRPTIRQQIARICDALGGELERARILELLDSDGPLLELCSNPFMLTVLCAVLIKEPQLPASGRLTRASLLAAALRLINQERAIRTGERPLDGGDYTVLSRLAHQLSFDPPGKRISFERTALETIHPPARQTTLAKIERSRLIDAYGADHYRFSHLRIQEYLAALYRTQTGELAPLAWQRALATSWQEEMKFLAALAADDPGHELWTLVRDILAARLDDSGFALVRVAGLLAAAACRDGGLALVGSDLRPRLWQLVCRGREADTAALRALAELDEDYLGEQLSGDEGRWLFESRPTAADDIPYRIIDRFALRGLARLWQRRKPRQLLSAIRSPTALTASDPDAQRAHATDPRARLANRLDSIYALGASHDHAAVPVLVRCLEDRNINVFHAACQALMTISGPRAAEALRQALVRECNARRYRRAEYVVQALKPENQGVLEPGSRDRLLAELGTLDRDRVGVKLRLEALRGALIPAEGESLLAILGARKFESAWTAAQIFEGVLDQSLMARALDRALDHRNRLVRQALVQAIRWIPRDYPRTAELGSRAFESDFVGAGDALGLCARTLRVVPHHPIWRHCAAAIGRLYERWPARMTESLQLACVEAADVLVGGARQAALLRNAITGYRSGTDGETLAFSAALLLWRIDGTRAASFMRDYLWERLPLWLDDFTSARHLFDLIIARLAAHDPGSIVGVLRRIDELRTGERRNVADELRKNVLVESAIQGLIVYRDAVLDRAGRQLGPS